MRFFVIKDPKESIAVVFHDHTTGYVLCRSKKDSFRQSFDKISNKISSRFIKKEGVLVLESFDVSNYDWIDSVLKQVCSSGYWNVVEEGEIAGSEEQIDLKIKEILA